MNQIPDPRCHHELGEGSSLVIAADWCSLQCEYCREIVMPVEPVVVVAAPSRGAEPKP